MEVGKISKQWSGISRELFTDADFFGISFPVDLDVRVKAVLIGACFLIVSAMLSYSFISILSIELMKMIKCYLRYRISCISNIVDSWKSNQLSSTYMSDYWWNDRLTPSTQFAFNKIMLFFEFFEYFCITVMFMFWIPTYLDTYFS